jgi:hypothetical protein
MVKVLDPNKTGKRLYTFEEICQLLLIEQVKQDVFKKFHPKPYAQFTKRPPPDYDTIKKKLRSKKKADRIVNERIIAYRRFLRNPASEVKRFLDTPYKPTKTWRQNWVETVRDYADLAAYCGLLPAWFKNPYRASGEDGYLVAQLMVDYLGRKVTFEDVLMGMKFSNSSTNIESYPKQNVQVRPFFVALRILKELKEKGIVAIQYSLLAATVGCLRSEDELSEAVSLIMDSYASKSIAQFGKADRIFEREAQRFSLSLLAFLESAGLISVAKTKRTKLVKVTDNGLTLLQKTPGHSVFYGHKLGDQSLTPLLGHLLRRFEATVRKDNQELDLLELEKPMLNLISEADVKTAIGIVWGLSPSPIADVTENKVKLNGLGEQYSVIPTVDFTSTHEVDFVELGIASIPVSVAIKPEVKPSNFLLGDLKKKALASIGSDYEDAISHALEQLSYGTVSRFGHRRSGQRVLDIVWEVPVIDSYTHVETKILILIEAKSGESIRQMDERVVMDDAKRTLEFYRNKLQEIAGIWVWILDSDQLPASFGGHGGVRPGVKSFPEKLNELVFLTNYISRPVVVTAMSIDCLLQYYSYLYAVIHKLPKNAILNETLARQFWVWGTLFRPVTGWVFIENDPRELERQLFTPS